ncbi:putative membrane protein [Paenibacillus sp. V4I9]|nr:putative membrane protein [Paenibacillus sp. V4I9]
MDIALALLSFFFMLFFLIAIRAILNKDKSDVLIFATSVFFGAILFISVVVFGQ